MLTSGNAALMTGEIPRGIQWLREAVAQCRQNNDLSTLLTAFALLAVGLRMQGKLRQVETVCLEALDEVNSQLGAGDWPLPTLALIYNRLGVIKREWNDLAGAEQALTQRSENRRKQRLSQCGGQCLRWTGGAAPLPGQSHPGDRTGRERHAGHSPARIDPFSRSLPGAESGILGAMPETCPRPGGGLRSGIYLPGALIDYTGRRRAVYPGASVDCRGTGR